MTDPVPTGPVPVPGVRTPLGVLRFSAVVDGHRVPGAAEEATADGLRWSHPRFGLELVVKPFEPPCSDPDLARPVDGCWGAVWRVTAHEPLHRVRLAAAFAAVPPGVEAQWDGGQGLTAVELHDGRTVLHLGGPDDEDLCLRAGADVPARWGGLLEQVYRRSAKWGSEVRPDHRGLAWVLPPMEPGEHVLVQAAVAWRELRPDDPEDDMSTWWAVLVNPEHVLRG
ncbi:hypothetical protein [Kitasatospora terrestris]|uniref:hypothetical protein n=1 Tax=Kitasatospora terrestris TaxID=258051 RepID=UPI0031F0917E